MCIEKVGSFVADKWLDTWKVVKFFPYAEKSRYLITGPFYGVEVEFDKWYAADTVTGRWNGKHGFCVFPREEDAITYRSTFHSMAPLNIVPCRVKGQIDVGTCDMSPLLYIDSKPYEDRIRTRVAWAAQHLYIPRLS